MQINEEENKAIEEIKKWRNYIVKNREKVNRANDIEFYLRTVLNLIEKQTKKIEGLKNLNEHQSKEITKAVNYTFELNKEIEIKDKMIDLMSEQLAEIKIWDYKKDTDILKVKEEVKEQFRKKAEHE